MGNDSSLRRPFNYSEEDISGNDSSEEDKSEEDTSEEDNSGIGLF